MVTTSLEQAVHDFDRSTVAEAVAAAEQQRQEVIRRFPREEWPTMAVERYAVGLSGQRDTFCRMLEFQTTELGSMKGGSSRKLIIYKHKDKPGWYFDPSYPDVQAAWRAVREAFVQAFSLAEAHDWAGVDALTPLRSGSALRTKAVFCYAPSGLLPLLAGIVDGDRPSLAPAGVVDQVTATVTGLPVWRAHARTDPCGLPGGITVVIAKSDSAALGIHGIAVRIGDGLWERRIFLEPQAPTTRRGAMALIGKAIAVARDEKALPIHLIVPDRATADVLVSVADSVAGVELSRMRWQRDIDMGRPALTFDGSPATLAGPISEHERLAVAFLLEQDRSRALRTRTPIVDLREVLASHVVPGGPLIDAYRLDYLIRWASATDPVAHREVSDEIEGLLHTPGARLSNIESDAIHAAYKRRNLEPAAYRDLVEKALAYKIETAERAAAVLDKLPVSVLREIYEVIEWQSQEVWWRRVALQALDLVRFGRTTDFWRNVQVDLLAKDDDCALQLACLGDYSRACDRALDAGSGELTLATVASLDPLRLVVASRRFENGAIAIALHLNGEPLVERLTAKVKIQAGSFKFAQVPAGPLVADGDPGLVWSPRVPLDLAVGDELILADATWFNGLQRTGHEFTVVRPPVDEWAAPKASCHPDSYATDPVNHRWCCRPHSVAEAETADYLAQQRAAGKMNPETWPPLVDEERFDVGAEETPELADTTPPDSLTRDDLGDE